MLDAIVYFFVKGMHHMLISMYRYTLFIITVVII